MAADNRKVFSTFLSIFLTLLVDHSFAASTIDFQATPGVIQPVLTKTLKLRCAVNDVPPPPVPGRRQLDASSTSIPATATTVPSTNSQTSTGFTLTAPTTTGPVPTSLTTNTITTNTNVAAVSNSLASSTTGIPSTVSVTTPTTPITTPTTTTTTTTTTAAPPRDTISSITISRLNQTTGTLQTVASVSPHNPPSVTLGPATFAHVDGDTAGSPIPSEEAFLSLTWDYPYGDEAGNYTCDISGLDPNLQPFTLQQSVEVTFTEPGLQDLISYAIKNDNYTTDLLMVQSNLQNLTAELQASVSDLQNQVNHLLQQNQFKVQTIQELETLVQNSSIPKVQTGISTHCRDESITFPTPFDRIPTVVLSMIHAEHNVGSNSDTHSSYVMRATSVTTTGFDVECDGEHLYKMYVSWLAMDI